jgi:hypothetical protein
MARAILIASFGLALLLLGSGCRISMAVNFGNGTASKVSVTSSETGKPIEIRPGGFKKFSHSSGNLIVKTDTNQRFKFADVAPFRVDPKYTEAHGNIFGFSSVTMTVLLETNMELYVVMPGKKAVDPTVAQPSGYPKAGEKEAQ